MHACVFSFCAVVPEYCYQNKNHTHHQAHEQEVLEGEKKQSLTSESSSTGDTTARRREKCVRLTKTLREQPARAPNQFHTLSPPRHCDVIHSSSSPSP